MTETAALPRPSLWQNRWWIVVGSMIGLMVGTGSILILSFGVFLKPVTEDLGWSRGAFSAALLAQGLGGVISAPIFGRMLDRYGIRRASLPMIAVFALALAALSLLNGSLVLLYVIFFIASMGGPTQGPLTFSKAIAAWFDKERGLALGIATTGSGIGAVVMPLISQALIDHVGWRGAYIGLAIINFVIAFAVFAFILRDPPGHLAPARAGVAAVASQGPAGTAAREALRTWRLWSITAIFTIGGIAINGTLAHVAALLTDRGLTPDAAAVVLSSSGIAIILGRILGGWLLDRLHAPYVGAVVLLLPAIGCALLAAGYTGIAPTVAVFLCGAGLGVELDMMGFFVSRYFGLKNFGEIYGYMFVGFAIGVGVGPALMGLDYDKTGSYALALSAFAALLIIAATLSARLGTYVFPKTEPRG